MPGYGGFADLGDVLVGGAGRRAEANYPKYLGEAANGYSALEKARIVRARALATENAPALYQAWATAQGMSPEAGALGANYSQRGDNFNTLMGGSETLGDMEIDRLTREALARGDTKTAQQLSAVKTDKVLPVLGAGGKAVFTPATGAVEMTALGEADVGATTALGEQRRASGQASLGRAQLYETQADAGGWKPGKTLSIPQVEAKTAYIMAEGSRLAKTRGEPWAEAWMKNEAAKAGIDMPFELGVDGLLPETAIETDNAVVKPPTIGNVKVDKEVVTPRGAVAVGPKTHTNEPTKVSFGSARGAVNGVTYPKVGTVMDGYRYMGGDPANPKSWRKL